MSEQMSPDQFEQTPLEESSRFAPPATRRDFLGLAAIWSAIVACTGAVIGAMRLPMPSIFPESNARVKIGLPEVFAIGSITNLPKLELWVFRDEKGIYAISSICTHLGCIVARDGETGRFLCPCHGSVFAANGDVIGGPAPTALHWKSMTFGSDGQIIVDLRTNVPQGTRLTV